MKSIIEYFYSKFNIVVKNVLIIMKMLVAGQGASGKLAMVTACTQVYAIYTNFHRSTRALAVTNLCLPDAP